jgi:hypothetical protein
VLEQLEGTTESPTLHIHFRLAGRQFIANNTNAMQTCRYDLQYSAADEQASWVLFFARSWAVAAGR